MGAWGIGSFDNDTSLDFLGEFINWGKIERICSKKKLSHDDYDVIRVSAEILIHLHEIKNLWADQEVINGLIDGLEKAIADESWHKTWNDSRDAETIIKQLKGFVRDLNKIEGY